VATVCYVSRTDGMRLMTMSCAGARPGPSPRLPAFPKPVVWCQGVWVVSEGVICLLWTTMVVGRRHGSRQKFPMMIFGERASASVIETLPWLLAWTDTTPTTLPFEFTHTSLAPSTLSFATTAALFCRRRLAEPLHASPPSRPRAQPGLLLTFRSPPPCDAHTTPQPWSLHLLPRSGSTSLWRTRSR
jgi:hypothetical protein